MASTTKINVEVAERMTRTQRVGLFGCRGAGKTTLLTMLYREAVGGRLPELRLAAANAATADYLSDKMIQLEAGQPLPGTLAETELRFQLYHGESRVEILVKDYQGEHIELGRDEPIRAFLRDCDAVWLCVDATTLADSEQRLRRQQEVEQLIEEYLADESNTRMHRPVALVLTKADLLAPPADETSRWAGQFVMIQHALETHCTQQSFFAVSSLRNAGDSEPRLILEPRGFAEPLTWLADALLRQDVERLESLWQSGAKFADLTACVECFARRYPGSPQTNDYRQRLRELAARRRRRAGLVATAAASMLLAGMASYDFVGYRQATNFESKHEDNPAAARAQWEHYQTWHPTRHLLGPDDQEKEGERLSRLMTLERQQRRDERLAELRRLAADPDADVEATWRKLLAFNSDYPDLDRRELMPLRDQVKTRREAVYFRKAQAAHDNLVSQEQRGTDLAKLVTQADVFLREFAESPLGSDVRERRAVYVLKLDERDIQPARDYSARKPAHYQTRIEQYQRYLDKRPAGGAFTQEAEREIHNIRATWDRHDYRAVYDLYTDTPGDVAGLAPRCRNYLTVHPQGRHAKKVEELLIWTDRVTKTADYKVVIRKGHFEKDVARFFSRGPDLSVEIEVNGVRYGPSTIIVNNYDPEWNYEFPRPIRWKLGDEVRIRAMDHDWKDRTVFDFTAPTEYPLSIEYLATEVYIGNNTLTLECDFHRPALSKP